MLQTPKELPLQKQNQSFAMPFKTYSASIHPQRVKPEGPGRNDVVPVPFAKKKAGFNTKRSSIAYNKLLSTQKS